MTEILLTAVEKASEPIIENKNISIRAVNAYYKSYAYVNSPSTARVPYTRPTVTNYPQQFSYFPQGKALYLGEGDN